MPVSIVGIDPGLTTGLVFTHGQEFLEGIEAKTYQSIFHFLIDHNPDIVVMEDFIVSPRRPSLAKPPLKTIGVVEYFCQETRTKLVMQSPSILSLMKQHAKGVHKSPHIQSAYAHILYFCRIRKIT